MKLLKKLFYGLMIIIMLCCAGILVAAMSPEITQNISTMLYGEAGPDAYGRDAGDSDSDAPLADDVSNVEGVAPGVLASENSAGYVAPIRSALNLPDSVSGKNGFEPMSGNDEELADDQADALGTELRTGATGDGLSFDKEFYPYYHMLNEKMQHLYRQIYANALEVEKSFAPVEDVNAAQLKNVFEAVYNDHPELFWLDTEYSCKYRQGGSVIEVTPEYNRAAANLGQSKPFFDEEARIIVNGAGSANSDLEKEEYIHNALIEKADYALSSAMNQSAYSALVNGDTVCAGYSRAFQYLMQQVGIPCYYCTGYSGEDHAWNIVKIDGEYYNVDVTWDDTDPSTYDYFNKTDAEFVGTHIRTGLSVYLPACGTGNDGDEATVGGSNNISGITLNPNPQQPLTWDPNDKTGSGKGTMVSGGDTYDLSAAGITSDMVQDSLKEYYEDCLKQMVEKGGGQQTFINIVPKYVLNEAERDYGTGAYEKGYVNEGLKKLELDYFAIQIQVEELGGNYYRLYHNIYTW